MATSGRDDPSQAAPDSPVRLSVVLPVRNGEPYLRQQLQALASQQCSFRWEVIVVDNGSTDASAETARELASGLPDFRVLSQPLAGKSHALNMGIAAARGELLVLVDADDEVGAGYLDAMARALDEFEMVSGRIDTTRLNQPWGRDELLPPDRLVEFLGFLVYIPGALIGIRSSARRRIGDFATDLPIAEDVDFTWRAQLLGITTGLAPDAVLHFRRPAGAWDNFRKARSYGRSHVWMYIRYRSKGMRRRDLHSVLGQVKAILKEPLRRRDHWQWRLAWHSGQLEGKLEESLRRRVWYP